MDSAYTQLVDQAQQQKACEDATRSELAKLREQILNHPTLSKKAKKAMLEQVSFFVRDVAALCVAVSHIHAIPV